MAVFSGPEILNAGLIVHLDAANYRSYPGSGMTWNDLSGNGHNGTLINGVGYSSNDNGSLVFDGANDFIQLTIPNIAAYNTITISAFIKNKSFFGKMFFGFTSYDVYMSNGTLGFNNAASNVIGISATEVSNLGLLNNFKHHTFVMNKTGLLTTNKIYINGVNQQISAVVGSNGNIPGFNTSLRLATWNNSSAYYGELEYGNFCLYNRELTPQEISQNFEATRSRYGI